MQINLKELKVVPCMMMMLFALQQAIDFNSIGMQMVSYAMLAMMLMGAMVSFFLILRQRTITLIDLLSIAFMVTVAASSLAHGTDFVQWAYLCFGICMLRFFFNYYQGDLRPLIFGLTVGFTIAVLAQFYQLITHPDLWFVREDKADTGYILGGNYNQIGVRLLITMILNMLCVKFSRWFYLLLIPCVVICLAIPVMVGSMTSATCITLFLLLCLIPVARMRRMAIIGLLSGVALFQTFVCFSGKGIENNDLMVWFVEDVLGKDITFTGRTHMWDTALRVISESPIWGWGYPDKDWYLTNMTTHAVGPHNILLATLIFGGIFTFLIYIYILVVSLFRAFSIRDYGADCIMIGISILCLMMLMEIFPLPVIFIFFLLAEYYPQFHYRTQLAHEQ